MIVMGIDPGANTGYAIWDSVTGKLLDYGSIKSKTKDPIFQRLMFLSNQLRNLIDDYDIDLYAIENWKSYKSGNVTTGSLMTMCKFQGVLLGVIASELKPVLEIDAIQKNLKKNNELLAKSMGVKKSSSHAYDAIGIAIKGYSKHMMLSKIPKK